MHTWNIVRAWSAFVFGLFSPVALIAFCQGYNSDFQTCGVISLLALAAFMLGTAVLPWPVSEEL